MTYSPALHKGTSPWAFSADRCAVLLLPVGWGLYAYGLRSLFITVISVFFALGVYFVTSAVAKRTPALHVVLDVIISAAVFAFTLPVSVPYYIPMLGGALAAAPSLWMTSSRKMFFGGFLSAAAVRLAFPNIIAGTTRAFAYISPWAFSPATEDVSPLLTNTPLSLLAQDKVSSGTILDQLFGTVSGNIGEISCILLLIGGVFLILRKRMRLHGPISFLATLCFITLLFPRGDSEAIYYMLVSMLSGGVILSAVFVFSDNLSMPVTDMGKIVFGVGTGLITVTIRYFTDATEGVYSAVVIMGALVPLIDKYTRPIAYGRTKIKGGNK